MRGNPNTHSIPPPKGGVVTTKQGPGFEASHPSLWANTHRTIRVDRSCGMTTRNCPTPHPHPFVRCLAQLSHLREPTLWEGFTPPMWPNPPARPFLPLIAPSITSTYLELPPKGKQTLLMHKGPQPRQVWRSARLSEPRKGT